MPPRSAPTGAAACPCPAASLQATAPLGAALLRGMKIKARHSSGGSPEIRPQRFSASRAGTMGKLPFSSSQAPAPCANNTALEFGLKKPGGGHSSHRPQVVHPSKDQFAWCQGGERNCSEGAQTEHQSFTGQLAPRSSLQRHPWSIRGASRRLTGVCQGSGQPFQPHHWRRRCCPQAQAAAASVATPTTATTAARLPPAHQASMPTRTAVMESLSWHHLRQLCQLLEVPVRAPWPGR